MPDEPRDHMSDCERHEREIVTLRDLVARREITFVELKTAIEHLETRIPERLGEALVSLSMKLDAAVKEVGDVKLLIKADFVHQNEFEPVKRIVYGMVTIILTAVIIALVALVVTRKGAGL